MKTAAIKTTAFESLILPQAWKESDFRDVTVENINYKVVFSFPSYFEDESQILSPQKNAFFEELPAGDLVTQLNYVNTNILVR